MDEFMVDAPTSSGSITSREVIPAAVYFPGQRALE
jgi:hypothetical protein